MKQKSSVITLLLTNLRNGLSPKLLDKLMQLSLPAPCISESCINPFSANPTKWSNTLKQFVGNNCLSVFDHFVKLAHIFISDFLSKISRLHPNCERCNEIFIVRAYEQPNVSASFSMLLD